MTGFRRRRKPDRVADQQLTRSVRDGPADGTSGLTRWQASRWAEIKGNTPHSIVGLGPERVGTVAGLHALADFLEANPAVPIPRFGHDFLVSTSGSDEQKRAQVKFASLAIGEEVMDHSKDSGHYSARRRFGSVCYHIAAVSDAAQRRWQQAVASQRDGEQGSVRFSSLEDDR